MREGGSGTAFADGVLRWFVLFFCGCVFSRSFSSRPFRSASLNLKSAAFLSAQIDWRHRYIVHAALWCEDAAVGVMWSLT